MIRVEPVIGAPESFDSFAPGPEDSLRTIRVGLAGCGVVGGALVRLFHNSAAAIEAQHGVRFEITRVLVRDVTLSRCVPLKSSVFTDDAASFNAEDVDVVVEAIGGEDTAGEIARCALGRGRKFVTANKQLIASAAFELSALAKQSATTVDFGAAVGGSAPVISLLRDLAGTPPAAVRGILNGTTNYILTRLEQGASFSDAVDAARYAGLAEPDCSRDLDGSDAAAKLAIIGWLSFGIDPSALCASRIGLTPTADLLVSHAAELGGKVRILAECVALPENRVSATVEPVVVHPHSAFARTELEDNRVEVDLGWSSPLAVSGPGAGGPPTATALLSDLLTSSAPRVDRRPAGSHFVQGDDQREHDWLIVTQRSSEIAIGELARFNRSAIRTETLSGDTQILVRARRAEVLLVLSAMRVRGLEPAVARIDSGVLSSALQ
jgi:homoserine dehydrogenase